MAQNALAESRSGLAEDPQFHEELQSTVTSKIGLGQPRGQQRPELSKFVRCVDAGNVACAYQAGTAHKNRLQATTEVGAAGGFFHNASGTE